MNWLEVFLYVASSLYIILALAYKKLYDTQCDNIDKLELKLQETNNILSELVFRISDLEMDFTEHKLGLKEEI